MNIDELQLPKQTHEIFNILARGHFISSNGTKDGMNRLYDILNDPENFQKLQAFFGILKYKIERGNNYFYFSKTNEPPSITEKKLETFEKYIDIIDLFASLDNKITIGSRFRPSEIAEECNANVRLKQKLAKIPLYRSETFYNKIREICDMLARDSFIELEDEASETYKVLDAYGYLLEVINAITIFGQPQNSQNPEDNTLNNITINPN